MPWKYHNLRREEREDGLHYKAELFVHDADRTTYAPVVGQQAGWIPTTDATVIDFAARPRGPHWGYEIVARQIQHVTRHRDHRGIYYQCLFYILASQMENLPFRGDDAYWAPTDSIDVTPKFLDYTLTSSDIGTAINYGFNVQAARTLTLYTPSSSIATLTYIQNTSAYNVTISGNINGVTSTTYTLAPGSTVSLIYTGSTWTVSVVTALPGNTSYIFELSSKMLGNGSFLVNLGACESKFEIGLTAT